MKPNLNRAWAILFARLVLGLIFFMAGVMKVFRGNKGQSSLSTQVAVLVRTW